MTSRQPARLGLRPRALALLRQERGLVVGRRGGRRRLDYLAVSLLGGGLSVIAGLLGFGGVVGMTAVCF